MGEAGDGVAGRIRPPLLYLQFTVSAISTKITNKENLIHKKKSIKPTEFEF
ncbi:MAG: hypothetical protein IKT27_01305 [Clostridia bacterium]|nr:hypothetical protein [Clostridia bacterium]